MAGLVDLLDVEHLYHSCVIYDDSMSCSYEVLTYSEVFANSSTITCTLCKILGNAQNEVSFQSDITSEIQLSIASTEVLP